MLLALTMDPDAAYSLASMQRLLHAPSAACAPPFAQKLLRPFCGWGLLELLPGAEQAIEENRDSYFVFRVIMGSVSLSYGNGRTRPFQVDVTTGDLFDVRPANYFGMRNASSGEWALLYYMYSLQVADQSVAVAEAGPDADESPPQRSKCYHDTDKPSRS